MGGGYDATEVEPGGQVSYRGGGDNPTVVDMDTSRSEASHQGGLEWNTAISYIPADCCLVEDGGQGRAQPQKERLVDLRWISTADSRGPEEIHGVEWSRGIKLFEA